MAVDRNTHRGYKLIPDTEEPSLGRRLGNLVAETALVVEHEESRRIAGVPYQTVLLRKPV